MKEWILKIACMVLVLVVILLAIRNDRNATELTRAFQRESVILSLSDAVAESCGMKSRSFFCSHRSGFYEMIDSGGNVMKAEYEDGRWKWVSKEKATNAIVRPDAN